MSCRYRLYPTPEQQDVLARHCRDARFVWNLALEQCQHARRFGVYADQKAWDRQLSEARRAELWFAEGSSSVQQAALRDLRQAFRNWWTNPAHFRPPTWRKAGLNEGFVVRDLTVRKLSRKWAEITVPKVGRVRFRLSRPVPPDAKTARVTRDRAGRWHVSIVSVPDQIEGPGTGEVVGVDRGVAVSFQASDSRSWNTPGLTGGEQRRLRLLQRRLARQTKGSNRRAKTRLSIARLKAREADRRRDMIEKATTELAQSADVVRIEDLDVKNMLRSASGTVEEPGTNVSAKRGLNRSIACTGWSMFAKRLKDKVGVRLELVPAAFTSQCCHECGHTSSDNRESQAVFRCTRCGHTSNADVNAALNIAAGQVVSARGGTVQSRPPNETRTTPAAADVSHAA